MIIPDISLLLYATAHAFPRHVVGYAWWEATLDKEVVGRTPEGSAEPPTAPPEVRA